MIVVLDNYDSFTYNLVQYLGELGETLAVYRNDKITVAEIAAQRAGGDRDLPRAVLARRGRDLRRRCCASWARGCPRSASASATSASARPSAGGWSGRRRSCTARPR